VHSRCRSEGPGRPGPGVIVVSDTAGRFVPPSLSGSSRMPPVPTGRSGSAENHEVMRDDAESDPAMHSIQTAVATAGEPVTMFKDADPTLAARPQSQSATEPAGARLTPATSQGHATHAARLCRKVVGARAEAAVG